MFATRRAVRPAVALLLTTSLVLPDLLLPVPVRAQVVQSESCVAGDRLLSQQTADKQAADEAWRLHWSRRHPRQLGRYQQALRAAIASQSLAPQFDQIAAELVFYVAPFMDGRGKVGLQQSLLQLVDRLAAVVPVNGRPIPADPPTGNRLKAEVERANGLYQATMLRQLNAKCYDASPSPPANVASNTYGSPRAGTTAMYSRSAGAVPISGSEASTPQVCAETKAVLVQLEREEREAREGLRRPTPAGASRADVELKYERAHHQADLRRQRMADLKCAGLDLPAVEPFRRREDPVTVDGARPSAPNSAVVCAETKNLLPRLEDAESAALKLRWAVTDNFHDSYFAMATLREAIRENKVDDDFDEIARMFDLDPDRMTKAQKLAAQPGLRREVKTLVDRVFAITGRERNAMIDAEFGNPTDALFESEDDEMPPVPAAVRRKEMEIEENYQQASYQAELRRQRLKDLNCDALPTSAVASDNGSLGRRTTMLKQDWGPPEHHYTYGENWAEKIFIGDPPDRRRIRWTWEGVPGSLNPGDEFTITINGVLDFKPPGSERGANNSAFVSGEGLVAIKEENAYFYQGASRIGTYKYQVPRDAKKVVITLSADNNQGHFVRHCYGQCAQ